MSAYKIIFKRSSILGKRPTDANLEAGEIGLNTNSIDPGLFFEVNDGSVVKAGPTAYLPSEPTATPAKGELWVDSDTKALSIGTDSNTWQTVAAPYLGGTGGYTVFVAPEYPNATDSLANDGQTVPYLTINRAILEITKKIISDTESGLGIGVNRYQIVLAPGRHCVVNGRGDTVETFNVNFDNNTTRVTQQSLQSFNPAAAGGLLLPRGVSIVGADLKKVEIHPTYVPHYTHPAFSANYSQQVGGPIYQNEPRTSVFKWTGNVHARDFVGLDKIDSNKIIKIQPEENTGVAILTTARPHGFNFNDFAKFTYTNSADQAESTFAQGAYYVYPITSKTFYIASVPWNSINVSGVQASVFPAKYFLPTEPETPKIDALNIYPYYIPLDGVSYETSNYSHHRLSVFANASVSELNEYYIKVQKAFPTFFSGKVNTAIASIPETTIVSTTESQYPENLQSNSVDFSSPYQNTVNHRSNFGMANGDFDGNIVSGFKSVIINSSTAVSIQKDPVAYEVYSTSDQNWELLTERTRTILGNNLPITAVPRSEQLKVLNETSIPEIRFYYETKKVISPIDSTLKSTGVADPDKDFRHFGFRLTGSESFMQAQSTYALGCAIGAWAKGGAMISLTNATTNFGSVAIQADGFAGIGTLGGSNVINRDFIQKGVMRPQQLTIQEVIDDGQKRILSLESPVQYVGIDPGDAAVQLIYLKSPFDPATILPYSLRPGSALFTSDGVCTYRAFFVNDGTPTAILSGSEAQNPYSRGGAVLRVRLSDSTIPLTATNAGAVLDVPFIRRYVDPRPSSLRSYGLVVENSSPTSQAPQIGSVLRLNQTGQNLSNSLKRNFQFDPGVYGGYAHIFTVNDVESFSLSQSSNYNNKISDGVQSTTYSVYLSLTDIGGGWIQSIYQPYLGMVAQDLPAGYYQTYQNKNYYLAENNSWSSLYYDTTLSVNNGPTKVVPLATDSPYVISSVLERSEPIADTWTGRFDLAPNILDPVYTYWVLNKDFTGNTVPTEYQVPASYKQQNPVSYFRGATTPYEQYAPQYQIDGDDGTPTMGLVYYRNPATELATTLVSDSITKTSRVPVSAPWSSTITRGRPATMELSPLSLKDIVSPKEGLSILQLSNPSVPAVEYVRVVGVFGNKILVERNCYPEFYIPLYSSSPVKGWVFIPEPGTPVTAAPPNVPVPPAVWPKGTSVIPCTSTGFPEPREYDPVWSATKLTAFRYYQLMGFSYSLMRNFLIPQLPGERYFENTQIPAVPVGGYANTTTSYPIEFNRPSTVIANHHTWQYCGYFDYSRGLPKYQVNQIPRKLSYDFLSSATYGGRLVITGTQDQGDIVFLGPLREAITGNFFKNESPLFSTTNKTSYTAPQTVPQPKDILVYSVDDISGDFDGSQISFNITRGGYPIPQGQLNTVSVFVFIGGVIQTPGVAYSIITAAGVTYPQITFTSPPSAGASCDIRVVTTEDNNATLEVQQITLGDFDGTKTSFLMSESSPTINSTNTFVFLGGVEQLPATNTQTNAAYRISYANGISTIDFLGGAPPKDTTSDIRVINSGANYRRTNSSSVYVTSVDDISFDFNNIDTVFPLTINGVPVDATKVNAENMFVSLGGNMQIPIAQAGDPSKGSTYSVAVSALTNQLEITFSIPPLAGVTCDIRIITSEEFLTCPLPDAFFDTALEDGPGITINDNNQIIGIDSGIIG